MMEELIAELGSDDPIVQSLMEEWDLHAQSYNDLFVFGSDLLMFIIGIQTTGEFEGSEYNALIRRGIALGLLSNMPPQ